jgi:hypothetical protein
MRRTYWRDLFGAEIAKFLQDNYKSIPPLANLHHYCTKQARYREPFSVTDIKDAL